MDAQGKARSFPDPGSVLVDVSELSIEERALILFRHARSAALEKKAKALIRRNAEEIIEDPNSLLREYGDSCRKDFLQ
jgi:hypothetical protein